MPRPRTTPDMRSRAAWTLVIGGLDALLLVGVATRMDLAPEALPLASVLAAGGLYGAWLVHPAYAREDGPSASRALRRGAAAGALSALAFLTVLLAEGRSTLPEAALAAIVLSPIAAPIGALVGALLGFLDVFAVTIIHDLRTAQRIDG